MGDDYKRGQFTFYRSYWEAIRLLDGKTQLKLLEAICSYALDGDEVPLTGVAASAFTLIRPTLDTGRKKAKAGKQGGSAEKAPRKQRESTDKANAKEHVTEGEKEIEKEIEIENDSLERKPGKESFSSLDDDENRDRHWFISDSWRK